MENKTKPIMETIKTTVTRERCVCPVCGMNHIKKKERMPPSGIQVS
jgi:hypothetical protein